MQAIATVQNVYNLNSYSTGDWADKPAENSYNIRVQHYNPLLVTKQMLIAIFTCTPSAWS